MKKVTPFYVRIYAYKEAKIVLSGGTGDLLDYWIQIEIDKIYQFYEETERSEGYEEFILAHESNYKINYRGSAGS